MAWHINVIGSAAEIQTALDSLVVSDTLEAQQFELVKQAILSSAGLPQTPPSEVNVGVLFAQNTLHLTAHGSASNISNRSNFTLQVVNTAGPVNIISNPDEADGDGTITTVAGSGGLNAAQFDNGQDGIIGSTGLTSTTLPIYLTDVGGLIEFNVPNLVSSTNYIEVDSCQGLESVDFSSLETCGDGTFGIYIYGHGNPAFTLLELESLVTVNGESQFTANTSLLQLLLPVLVTSSDGINANGCTALDTVSFPVFLPTNGTTIDFSDCDLSEASVDHILARCVASAGYVSGTVDVSGGTSAAPSAAGDASALILTGRGVTVNTN